MIVSLNLHFDGRCIGLTPADRESLEWCASNDLLGVFTAFQSTWLGRPIRTSATTDVATMRADLLNHLREAFPETEFRIEATMAWTETVQTTRRVP
jgi:hypothetical protein